MLLLLAALRDGVPAVALAAALTAGLVRTVALAAAYARAARARTRAPDHVIVLGGCARRRLQLA
jgi:hypothetical protein